MNRMGNPSNYQMGITWAMNCKRVFILPNLKYFFPLQCLCEAPGSEFFLPVIMFRYSSRSRDHWIIRLTLIFNFLLLLKESKKVHQNFSFRSWKLLFIKTGPELHFDTLLKKRKIFFWEIKQNLLALFGMSEKLK